MGSPAPETVAWIFWGIETVFALILLVRLYRLQLQGVYRIFVVYLLAEVLGLLLFALVRKRIDYRLWFLWSRPLYWFLYIAMVFALARATMRSVPGVYRLSRKVLVWSFVVAGLVGAGSFFLGKRPGSSTDPLHYLSLLATSFERSVTLTALLLLIGVLAFLVWFPVQVPRNLAVFSGAYLLFFAVTVTALYAGDFLPPRAAVLLGTRVIEIVSAICYIWWLLTLTKAGEMQPVRVGHIWKRAEQERLLAQLNAINEALLAGSRNPT